MVHLNRLTAILDVDTSAFTRKLNEAKARAEVFAKEQNKQAAQQEIVAQRQKRADDLWHGRMLKIADAMKEIDRLTALRDKQLRNSDVNRQRATDALIGGDKAGYQRYSNTANKQQQYAIENDKKQIALRSKIIELDEKSARAKTALVKAEANLAVAQARTELATVKASNAMAKADKVAEAYSKTLAARVQHSFNNVAQKMHQLSYDMIATITLPLVAIGKSAVSATIDYDKSFKKMGGLTNFTAQQLDVLNQKLLEMAPAMGKTPQELADTMYYLGSSGIKDTNKALNLMTLSAKASVSGLGDMKTIADVLTSVMAAYGEKNISAAQTLDVLTAAVREGKGEPESYAVGLSKVIGVAGTFGVKFKDVMAVITTATLAGFKAETAITGIRTAITDLIRAAAGGRNAKVWSELGFNIKQVSKNLREDFLGTLVQIANSPAVKNNPDVLARLFPNARGFATIMAVIGPQMEKAVKVQEAMNKAYSTGGDAQSAYAEGSKSLAFQVDKMNASVQTMYVGIGQRLLPVMESVTKVVSDLATWFAGLSPDTQEWIIKVGLLAAALGPLFFTMSNFMKFFAMSLQVRIFWKTLSAGATVATEATATATAATNASTVALNRATLAALGLRAVYLGMYALAAVPIVITVKAVYDYSAATSEAWGSMSDYANTPYGPADYIKGRRQKGDKRSRQELLDEFKKSDAYRRFNQTPTRKANIEAFNRRMSGGVGNISQQLANALKGLGTGLPSIAGGGGGGGNGKGGSKVPSSVSYDNTSENGPWGIFGPFVAMRKIREKFDEDAKKIQETAADKITKTFKELFGLTDPAKKFADAIGLTVEEFNQLTPAQKKQTENIVAMKDWLDAEGLMAQATASNQKEHMKLMNTLNEMTGVYDKRIKQMDYYGSLVGITGTEFSKLTEQEQNAIKWTDLYTTMLEAETGILDANVASLKEKNKALSQYGNIFGQIWKAIDKAAGPGLIAKLIGKREDQLKQMEHTRAMLNEFVTGVGDIFSDMIYNIAENGFGHMFAYIYDGFKKLLFRMAVEYLQSQLVQLFGRLIGGIFGVSGVGGGDASSGGAGQSMVSKNTSISTSYINNNSSKGASYLSSRSYMTAPTISGITNFSAGSSPGGGPEISTAAFSSSSSNSINAGAPIIINFNINTPDVAGFRKTQPQLMLELQKSLQRTRSRFA